MVRIVASWRCKCGTRVEAVGQADLTQARATQIVACPRCGNTQTVHADTIVSVTEDTSDISPALHSEHGAELRPDAISISPCSERDHLLVAQNEAFEIYMRAVGELAQAGGAVAHAEFEFAYNKVRTARQFLVETRDRLREHIVKHGC